MGRIVLYQLELDQRKINCGMRYVLQLENGDFFLVDGGYFTPGEEDRLYRFLLEHAPDGKPTIAGWFFSHAHQDHVGTFINFTKKYASILRAQTLFYNIQPIDFSQVTGDWKSSDLATVQEFYRVVDAYYPQEAIHILHTGEQLDCGGLHFEVLYTQEDLYPAETWFNDYSAVIRMEVKGQRLLWLGDIQTLASQWLLEHKREKLSCDIVQISHHGFGGATKALYAATGAKVALWPTPDYCMSKIADHEVNRYLLKESDICEHIVSGEGDAALPLPYTPGTAKRWPKKIWDSPNA